MFKGVDIIQPSTFEAAKDHRVHEHELSVGDYYNFMVALKGLSRALAVKIPSKIHAISEPDENFRDSNYVVGLYTLDKDLKADGHYVCGFAGGFWVDGTETYSIQLNSSAERYSVDSAYLLDYYDPSEHDLREISEGRALAQA